MRLIRRSQRSLRGAAGNEVLADQFRDGRTLLVFAHQDDDLLWMMPFWGVARKFILAAYPAADVFGHLVRSFPRQCDYARRWVPAWGTVDNDVYAEIFTDVGKRAPIVNVRTIAAHLRPLFTGDIRRVVTHNNWGEYGHAQHRAVNIAVRGLAAELCLDVWALGNLVKLPGDNQSAYIDVAASTGLPTIEGNFDGHLFRMIRDKYLEAVPAASTPELTEKFRRWSKTLWTWSDAQDAFPMGWRPFIQLMQNGTDLTLGNSAIERLEREVAPVNPCVAEPAQPAL